MPPDGRLASVDVRRQTGHKMTGSPRHDVAMTTSRSVSKIPTANHSNDPTSTMAPGQCHPGDPRPIIARAMATAGEAIAAVRPDQMTESTPCDEFDRGQETPTSSADFTPISISSVAPFPPPGREASAPRRGDPPRSTLTSRFMQGDQAALRALSMIDRITSAACPSPDGTTCA